MRLIDADKLLRDIEHYHLSDGKFQHWVEIQPTIERKTGKWSIIPAPSEGYCGYIKCPFCGTGYIEDDYNFCPNCGADMRGGNER